MFLRFKSNIPDGRVYNECRRSRSLFKCKLKCSLQSSLSETKQTFTSSRDLINRRRKDKKNERVKCFNAKLLIF